MRLPRWRKATWALVIWSAIILIWAIGGGSSAAHDCAKQATELDQSACQAGTGIGVALILTLGFFGFVLLSLVWLMSRPKARPCPRCGSDVKKGVLVCPSCSFDFASLGQPVAAQSSPTQPPAGWYADPATVDGTMSRYWDGSRWTDDVRAAMAQA